jgi:hypothetical protein
LQKGHLIDDKGIASDGATDVGQEMDYGSNVSSTEFIQGKEECQRPRGLLGTGVRFIRIELHLPMPCPDNLAVGKTSLECVSNLPNSDGREPSACRDETQNLVDKRVLPGLRGDRKTD